MRPTYSGIVDAHAECYDCTWKTHSYKNALALAAQHHDRTGHTVSCDQVLNVKYGHGDYKDESVRAPKGT